MVESEKNRKYEERIREIEHSTFSSLVFSTSGGMGPVATQFFKRLSLFHSEKHQSNYKLPPLSVLFCHPKVLYQMSTGISFPLP